MFISPYYHPRCQHNQVADSDISIPLSILADTSLYYSEIIIFSSGSSTSNESVKQLYPLWVLIANQQ